MKNMKFWRTALVATLVLTVMLSVTGGTIAWFTDEVTSANNVIKSGTLDLEVEYSNDGNTWTPITEAKEALFNYTLWEPGYVAQKAVKIINNGDLAFKYKMLFQPTADTKDEPYRLEDVIDVYMGDAAFTRESLKTATPVATLADLMYGEDNDGTVHGHMLASDADKIVYIALKMRESADNNYQNLSVGNGFGLKLEAAQLASESDSFDSNYDKDAPYGNDVWNGETGDPENVPTEDENGVITISTAEELAAFAAAVNAGNSYSGKTVKLDANIDLNNNAWTPIGDCESGKYFQGTFDGQGHTISGLNVDKSDDEYKYSTAGFFGWIDAAAATIKNVNFDGATVKGSHWVGVVAGFMTGEISNCHVTNSTVTGYNVNDDANGDKVGGIVGYMNTGAGKLDGNSVKNSTISGNRDVAGLAGAVAVETNTITNNHVENVNIYYAQEYVGEIVSPKTAVVVDASNTAENVLISVKHEVSTVAGLEQALNGAGAANAGNNVITLTADLDMENVSWTPIKVDGYHGADIVTIEGNGHTITNLSAPLFAGGFAGGSGIVIKDLTIADSAIVSTNTQGSGAFVECVDSMDVITLTNCHLKNSTLNGSRTGGLIGWTAGYNNVNDGPVKLYVTVKDCSVVNCTLNATGSLGAIIGHSGGNAWTYTTVENCTVKNCTLTSADAGDWRVGVVVGTANVGEMTISNITESGNTLTQTDKTAPAGQSNLYGRFVPGETGKLTIN